MCQQQKLSQQLLGWLTGQQGLMGGAMWGPRQAMGVPLCPPLPSALSTWLGQASAGCHGQVSHFQFFTFSMKYWPQKGLTEMPSQCGLVQISTITQGLALSILQ